MACPFCLLSRRSVYPVLNFDEMYIVLFGCVSLGFIAGEGGVDWQFHLLDYDGQLFLHYWQP